MLDTFQNDLVDIKEDIVTLKSWEPQINEDEKSKINDIINLLHQGVFAPPRLDTNLELLGYLLGIGEIKDLGDGVIFTNAHYLSATKIVLEQFNLGQNSSLAEIRDLIGTNRRIAQALLETMDKEGITQRLGDERRITEAGKLFLENK